MLLNHKHLLDKSLDEAFTCLHAYGPMIIVIYSGELVFSWTNRIFIYMTSFQTFRRHGLWHVRRKFFLLLLLKVVNLKQDLSFYLLLEEILRFYGIFIHRRSIILPNINWIFNLSLLSQLLKYFTSETGCKSSYIFYSQCKWLSSSWISLRRNLQSIAKGFNPNYTVAHWENNALRSTNDFFVHSYIMIELATMQCIVITGVKVYDVKVKRTHAFRLRSIRINEVNQHCSQRSGLMIRSARLLPH